MTPLSDFSLTITEDWCISAVADGKQKSLTVSPPPVVTVAQEKIETLPEFNPSAWGGWQKGYALLGIRAQECTTKGALDSQSLRVTSGDQEFQKGVDFEADLDWGGVGRLPGGKIRPDQPVTLSYSYSPQRIDSVILGPGHRLSLRSGIPHIAIPLPPDLASGETRLANIYLPCRSGKLTPDNLFPVLEQDFPETLAASFHGSAAKLIPRAFHSLTNGGNLRILAWGDSVTDGAYLPNRNTQRWQEQFVARLRQRFPGAQIELLTEAWGGRNTSSYLAEPPGALHNYQEKVLDARPDLIIMEFVNDAGLKTSQVEERYNKLLADFRAINAELILLTPHYVRPDWMGLTTQREIDSDPREYVQALRAFATRNNLALADAAQRYGRLWRQGIPYLTLMMNNINHPDPRGMKIFADSLINLFP